MENSIEQKKQIRAQIERKRRRLSPEEVEAKSRRVLSHLKTLPAFQQARTVHTYVAWRNEVDTHALIRELLQTGRRVIVPIVDTQTHSLHHAEISSFDELEPGTFGILEPPLQNSRPLDPDTLDLVIVPGVAFDPHGNRVGFGGGYYDQFLAHVRAPKIALAYRFQIVDRIPTRNEDQRVDIIVT
ncbi:MAG: 5-formyltetrahydrofolate cyclo-ligase, partial [Calditrichaeota bacterium]